MRWKPKPGFMLVARREWRWLLRDRAALILIFGVPLFAFAVLAAVFSHPVIRELGIVIVDADRSESSRAFVEEVAESPGLSIVERASDLAAAGRAIRSGEAIAAVYLPADFERDLKAGRRSQWSASTISSFSPPRVSPHRSGGGLTAAASARRERTAPKALRIGSLVAETSRCWSIRSGTPPPSFSCARCCRWCSVIITLSAGSAVGSSFAAAGAAHMARLRGRRPIVDCAGRLPPAANLLCRRAVGPLILEGLLGISFKGDVPMIVVAASLLIVGFSALGALVQLSRARPRDWPRSPPHRLAGVRLCRRGLFPTFGMNTFDQRGARYCRCAGTWRCCSGRRRTAYRFQSARPFAALATLGVLYSLLAVTPVALGRADVTRRARSGACGHRCGAARRRRRLRRRVAARAGDAAALSSCLWLRHWSTASSTRSPISIKSCARSRSPSSTTTSAS